MLRKMLRKENLCRRAQKKSPHYAGFFESGRLDTVRTFSGRDQSTDVAVIHR